MRAVFWMGIGAGAMYLLDPEQGLRRRTRLQEQLGELRQMLGERGQGGGVPEPVDLEPQAPAEVPAGAYHLGR